MSDFTSFYDILPEDHLHKSYMAALGGAFGMSPGGFSFPPTCGNQAHTLPTSNFTFPFPTPTSTPGTPSTGWPTSLEPTPATSFGPPPGQLLAYGELEADDIESTPTSLGKRKQSGATRRPRGPNKRPPGAGYSDMMGRLSPQVQEALKKKYPGCCQRVHGSDESSLMKHRFSRGHYSMVAEPLQSSLPFFTCPAFLAMHPSCKRAPAGRYDSVERHCKKCPGFREINEQVSVFPIEITGAEFDAVQRHRQLPRPGKETDFSVPVQRAVSKLLAVMIKAMYPNATSDDSGASDAMDVASGELYTLPLNDGEDEECGGDHDDFSWF
ncbi:hypothetical protein BC826DRAFT_141921 [Russula brevipes]|nr:hypothetical protein BC826DRAFT_141921 [Russula brevipes]